MLLELFHVCADKHLAQLDEVAVFLVVDFDDTPWVATAADLATIRGSNFSVRANYGEGDLGHDFLVLRNSLLVVKFIAGPLENLDGVVLDIGKNLFGVLLAL
jgi:hypothetical protein